MKVFFIYIIIVFSVFTAHCQQIFGTVTDDKGSSIANVSIGTVNLERPVGTASDSAGNYSLKLKNGIKYKIRFSCIGYDNKDTVITLYGNEKRQVNISLAKTSANLQEVKIKGDKSREEGITKINTEDAKTSVGVNIGIENAVKSQEGVSSNNELSTQYSVRGGNFDENLVYVNDIEIFRPLLIRNGQQEGLSFVNTDMTGDIKFSSGGFDAKYGDKMSSVLDIKYRKPEEFKAGLSLSLLGATAHIEDKIGSKFTYLLGFRNKTNKYILNSLQTDGEYNSVFNDFQAYLTYNINDKTELAFLGNLSDNKYNFVPQTRETQFGTFYQTMNLKVYFDGQELDRFTSVFGALNLKYRPTKDILTEYIISAFNTSEKETYDIQGQYWLYETGGFESEEIFDRGIGTYLEHARNKLNANIFNFQHRFSRYYDNGYLSYAVQIQHESINDKIKEWKMVDSADYTIPSVADIIGQYDNPLPPALQNTFRSKHTISSNRITAFVQRQLEVTNSKGSYYFNIGVRGQFWDYNKEFFPSPRLSVSYLPNIKQDILFRIATGLYAQFPFYREFRDNEGNLNPDIKSQKSWHLVLSSDWNFKMMERKFKFTSAVYYKYLWDIIPYRLDNVRIRYSAQNNAVGYVAGIDLKLFGEFIKGIDSWVTLSLMQTKQDIDGDNEGYIARPTDQLLNISVSFQDYIPNMPWMRVYLNLNYGSGYPYYRPNGNDVFRMPSYLRADMAFTFRIKDENTGWAKNNFMKYCKRMWFNIEWLNVFNNKNVISYTYVQDYSGNSFSVPDYLTPSLVNARLTLEF